MSDTLILNANGKPLSLNPLSAVHWHISIKLMFLQKAKPLEYHTDWNIHSPSLTMRVPSIMILNKYYRQEKEPKFTRGNVHLRDLFTCQYCGDKKDLTFDHLLPKSKGGVTDWENVVTACSTCNVKKGGKLLKHSGMKLHQYPFRPSTEDLHKNGKNFPPNFLHKSWMDYLYWDVELEA